MDAIGARSALPGAAAPEPYEATGRWTEYGDNIFRLKDRKGPTTCSAPPTRRCSPSRSRTCIQSYKDLPLSIYQIQTKYRDEARPRAGCCAAASS
jgi:prolyl-tRNA synthetase